MIQMKKIAKEKLQSCIVRDLEYDGAKCNDFAHTILQKHVMDLTSKMYKRHLENLGMKLLTKIPKDGNLPHDDEQIYINHAKFDSLKTTYVYCVSFLKANSSRESTKIFSNEIDPLTPELGAGFADEKKEYMLEHINSGLADPSLEGNSILSRVSVAVFVFVFVLILDSRLVRVNTPITPCLSTSFKGFKLSARHQPFLQGLRARPKGISPPSCRHHRLSHHCRGQARSSRRTFLISCLCNGHCGSMVRAGSRTAVYPMWV
jgi:hypothetical protein